MEWQQSQNAGLDESMMTMVAKSLVISDSNGKVTNMPQQRVKLLLNQISTCTHRLEQLMGQQAIENDVCGGDHRQWVLPQKTDFSVYHVY